MVAALPRNEIFAGGETEDTRTADALATALRKRGVGARTFPKFRIRNAGRVRLSKPDVEITDGGVHIVSAKFGEDKELDAFITATAYKEEIPYAIEMEGKQLGEVFAVTYPARKHELFRLLVLPRELRKPIPLPLKTIEDVADRIIDTIRGRYDYLSRRAEPVAGFARRILYQGALGLADTIQVIEEEELETIFGGHDFFRSVLAARLKGEERRQALRRGPAFLFVNQVLFYVLLSNADRVTGNMNFPSIRAEDASQPQKLQEYFNKVRNKNYEPIYGIDVAHLFAGKRAEAACNEIVKAIQGFAPSLDTPDLAGQVFQTLIPLEIRKPLGAHYTNPKAAALLAGLTITAPDATVFDPACGSGTLLVAAYRRKKDSFGTSVPSDMHRRFVETEITGLDAMAFSGHLAAVNLALQSPLQDTDHVRIGTCDSTTKRPTDFVKATQNSLAYELKQSTLLESFQSVPKKKTGLMKGPVKVRQSEAKPFQLQQVDLVIMNPPFTSWDNMASDYREGLKRLFSGERPAYRDAIHWKTSQQTFFLLLADRFLKEGGTVAAVLPITTFTGVAFAPLTRFLLTNYTIRYVVVGLGRLSFSEQTNLADCLLVAEKKPPSADSTFLLVGTLKPPETWSELAIESMIEGCKRGTSNSDDYLVTQFPQISLNPNRETLSGLIFRLIPEFRKALSAATEVEQKATISFVTLSALMDERGLEIRRWILGGGYLAGYAPQALFLFRTKDRAIRDKDRLLLQSEEDNFYSVVDKKNGSAARLRKDVLVPALRRVTHLSSFDATGITDLCVIKPNETVRELVSRYYGKESQQRWKRITQGGKDTLGPWSSVIPKGSSRVALARRLNLAAKGTRLVCCRSTEPFFLAGDSFMVLKFENTLQEKLMCLWMNSSLTILRLLEKTTITGGTWVKLEKFRYRQVNVPDSEKLSAEQQKEIERLYDEFSKEQLPALKEQLKQEQGVRARLDNAMLSFVGVSESDAERIGANIRSGILAVIETLEKSMPHRAKKTKGRQLSQ